MVLLSGQSYSETTHRRSSICMYYKGLLSELRLQLETPNVFWRLKVKRMSFWGSSFVFFPHLDGLISFTADQPWAGYIVGEGINASLTVQWPWNIARNRINLLLLLIKVNINLSIHIPGWTIVWDCWKLWPLFQSQNHMLPLSPTQGDAQCISSTSLTSSLRTKRREVEKRQNKKWVEWVNGVVTLTTSHLQWPLHRHY